MDRTEKLEQRLRQLQRRCDHLTQQLETERTAAAATQANLTHQIDQQTQRLLALEAQVNTDIGDRPPLDATHTPTEHPIEQELQRIAEENRQFRQTIDTQAVTYRHLFDCNPQPMLVYDLETLRFLAVNEAMIAKYGYSRAEFLSMTIADIRPPEDLPRLLENVAQVDSGLDMAGLWQHRLRDGRIIHVEIVSYALEFEGRRAELVMAHDVTQRVKAEQALHDLNRSLEQTVAERTAALRKSQTELQAILNNSPTKLFVADLEGRYIFVNQTFLRLFNCQLDDVLGKSIHEVFPPHIADAFRANDQLLLEQGGVQQFEEVVRVNGEDRVFLSNKFLLRDDQGEVYAICGMSTDINDRKATEEELQDSRDRLQAMLAAVPDLVFRVNRDGQYLDFYPSHSTVDVTGLDNLVGQNLTEVLPPDLAQAHLHRIEHVLNTQTMQVSEQHIQVNGELRREEVRVAPCGTNEVLFVVRDITERKQAELALQASQHLMQTVLDTTPIGIFWKNRDGVYQGNNSAAAELLGLTDAPLLIGRTDADLPWAPETLAMIQTEDQQIMATDIPCLDILQSFTLENDTQLWLETNKVPLKDGEGNVVGIVGTAQDVTQRKRDEMERQSLTDRLTLALQAGACGTWDWDMVHDALWDERMYEIYGLQTLGRAATYQDWRDRVHPDDISGVEARLQAAMCDEIPFNVEFRIWRTDGELRWVQAIAQLQHDSQGIPIRMVGINQDITCRKQAELDLEAYADRVEDLYNNAPCGYYSLDAESRVTGINNTALRWLDYPREAVWGQPLTQFITEASRQIFAEQRTLLTQARQEKSLEYEIILLSRTGEQMNVLISEEVQKNAEGTLISSRATMTDIRQRLQAERKLQQQYTRENLLRQVTARIRQSLDLSTIFDTACNEVRQALKANRAAIFKFYPEANFDDGEFIAESVVGDYPSVVAIPVHDHCFGENFANLYAQGRYYAVADIEAGNLSDCHEDILRQFQVRANLVVPLIEGENALWGLLCVHQCSHPRPWQPTEIDLAQQIANQLAIAIHQASLYQRIQSELAVRQRAEAQITRQLEQQRTLAKLTETVRESLAVNEILNTATRQVKELLQCDRVIIFRLYPDGRSRIVEEAVVPEFPCLKDRHWDNEIWSEDILELYWQGRPRIVPDVMHDVWTECLIDYSRAGQIQSKVVAPILQETHASEHHRWVAPWGDSKLWGIIVAHACREQRVWQEPEAELLQQVANSVAIAIQQANLFEQLQQELGKRQRAKQQLAERNQQLSQSNQELARATRLKDEFLANMSHELRTPLNAILGMAEGMQEEVFGPLTDRQRRSLNIIEISSHHLLSLINDVLDVAKIEAGQLELDYADVNVNLLCDSSITLIKQQARKKHLQLEMHVPSTLPNLYGDERRLRQILVNLLSNAVKFTPDSGRITVTASYTALTPEDIALPRKLIHPQGEPSATVGILTLSVADTGIGISAENAKKLFQPFVQVDSALNRQHEGTGLGLALVKRITEMHGGQIELASEVGQGSCFTVQLPIMAIPSSPASPALLQNSIEAPTPIVSAAAPLILLAEDNEANIKTTTAYLDAKGYRLIVARDGAEALNLANSALPDLILMDIQMPKLDGLEAIRQIRQTPSLAHVPIVALTALAMESDQERCIATGANEYICKPVRLRQLFQVIQTLLAKSSSERAI